MNDQNSTSKPDSGIDLSHSAVARLLLASKMAKEDNPDEEVSPPVSNAVDLVTVEPSASISVARSQTPENDGNLDVLHVDSDPLEDDKSEDGDFSDECNERDETGLQENDLTHPDYYQTPSDVHVSGSDPHRYKCRICPFTCLTYGQLQQHMTNHGGAVKALKCPLCDYTTNHRSNFRRHKRLHTRSMPVSVLKCSKCTFTTIVPRKFREHHAQEHSDSSCTSELATLLTNSSYRAQQLEVGSLNSRVNHPIANPVIVPASSSLTHSNPHALINIGNSNSGPYIHSSLQHLVNGPINVSQFSAFSSVTQRQATEGHLASNYLRSIVSSIVNSHPTVRAPTSSVTSSTTYLTSADHPQQHSPTALNYSTGRRVDSEEEVKIKTEPLDCEGISDVSSTANAFNIIIPQPQRYTELTSGLQRQNCNDAGSDKNVDTAQSTSNAIHRVNSDESMLTQSDVRLSHDSGNVNSTVNVKSEANSRGVQCNIPIIKCERNTPVNIHNLKYQRFFMQVDKGVQCELISTTQPAFVMRNIHPSEITGNVQQNVAVRRSRCAHCEISFEDDVLFSIHIGCHSHTDPFRCNVCGKQCHNKYGFYSHILRGHHF